VGAGAAVATADEADVPTDVQEAEADVSAELLEASASSRRRFRDWMAVVAVLTV
jgi:hypothetical protein